MSRKPCTQCGTPIDTSAKFCAECGAQNLLAATADASPKGTKGAVVFVILMIALPVGFMLYASSASVEGEIRSQGAPFGTYVQKPPACHSGQHESFFGVWVAPELKKRNGRSGFQGGIKLLKNELGQWRVFLESPLECEGFKCTIRELEPKACKVFDVEVHNTGTSFNDIVVKEGHARLECRFPEGGSLSVNLKFDGCS